MTTASPPASVAVLDSAVTWTHSCLQLARTSDLTLPTPTEDGLAWFVREAWPSPATGTACTEGRCETGQTLEIQVRSDRLVAFGDGIEADALELSWGQSVRITTAAQQLRLVR